MIFPMGDETIGLDVDIIEKVLEVDRFTLLPMSPPWVKGVMVYKGAMVLVIDLMAFLGLPLNKTSEVGGGPAPLRNHPPGTHTGAGHSIRNEEPDRVVIIQDNRTLFGLSIGSCKPTFLWKDEKDRKVKPLDPGRIRETIERAYGYL